MLGGGQVSKRAFLERLSRELADKGKLIEAGFVGMRLACDLDNAPADQLAEMRMAFFGGAQHLYSSIMTILEPGAEPTDKDLARMELIHNELQEFIKDFEARLPPKAPATKLQQTLGDAPIEQQYREQMNSMAQYIDRYFNSPNEGHNRKTGFILMTFAFGHEGRCNYISNARREDVVVALKEQLARFGGSPDVTGYA
jgi:hypothetical protein